MVDVMDEAIWGKTGKIAKFQANYVIFSSSFPHFPTSQKAHIRAPARDTEKENKKNHHSLIPVPGTNVNPVFFSHFNMVLTSILNKGLSAGNPYFRFVFNLYCVTVT